MKAALQSTSLAGACLFVCAALVAMRLAVADTLFRRDTSESVRQAIAFEWPAPQAAFELRLAELDPAHAREALKRAVLDNPRSSEAWIAMGLLEDAGGDSNLAEQALLRAAQSDRQYLPAWTLANFYFRRENLGQFWLWANRAAPLVYDDFRPLLQLCDQFEPDPARMLSHLPGVPRLRSSYLDFLIGENRLDAAQQIARTMAGDRANDPLLINLADRQLRAGNAASAIELWNASSGFPSGTILTNGDLARAPLNLGFDWRVGQIDGVARKWRPRELSFTFSGSQPEACVLLEQTILLIPRRFRLRFEYITSDPAPTGIRWSLDDAESPPIEPSSLWKQGVFELPQRRGLQDLKLFYRREPGTTRTEGRIELRNLWLEEAL